MDFRWPPPPDGRPDRYRPPVNRGPQTGRPTLPVPPTELVATPHGVELECLATGSGRPVTVFAHGLAGGIAETRPLGSGVHGRRVFFQFQLQVRRQRRLVGGRHLARRVGPGRAHPG